MEKLSAEQLEEIRAKAQEQRVMAELPVLGVSFIGTWENEVSFSPWGVISRSIVIFTGHSSLFHDLRL